MTRRVPLCNEASRSSGRAKKKELLCDFKNGGREWQPDGHPEAVRVHDFVDRELGKALPYGVYDVAANQGCRSVGIDHDTASFDVASGNRWASQPTPTATELLIVTDCGGSNSGHTRLWRTELQHLAEETGHRISVPLSPWYEQVEYDRASFVLPHHPALAWTAARSVSAEADVARSA